MAIILQTLLRYDLLARRQLSRTPPEVGLRLKESLRMPVNAQDGCQSRSQSLRYPYPAERATEVSLVLTKRIAASGNEMARVGACCGRQKICFRIAKRT